MRRCYLGLGGPAPALPQDGAPRRALSGAATADPQAALVSWAGDGSRPDRAEAESAPLQRAHAAQEYLGSPAAKHYREVCAGLLHTHALSGQHRGGPFPLHIVVDTVAPLW